MNKKSFRVRLAESRDLDALYAISLKTGDAGRDAEHLFHDPHLVGHIYSAPYVAIEGCISFVAEDEDGVFGYAVGAVETRSFEALMASDWLPELRNRYQKPVGVSHDWTPDEHYHQLIHNPASVPDDVVQVYPAHIHMNLLERARGKGAGSGLLNAWIAAAREEKVTAVHAGVSATNIDGLKFWMSRGFKPFREESERGGRGTIWCGRTV